VRHGFDETAKLAHKRGGKRRVIVARVRYKTVDAQGNADVITTPMPAETLPAAIATPSLAERMDGLDSRSRHRRRRRSSTASARSHWRDHPSRR
jgi:hypothetical protein